MNVVRIVPGAPLQAVTCPRAMRTCRDMDGGTRKALYSTSHRGLKERCLATAQRRRQAPARVSVLASSSAWPRS